MGIWNERRISGKSKLVHSYFLLNSLLIMVCLAGLVTDQMIMVVSNEPLATSSEFGDQATVLTRAL